MCQKTKKKKKKKIKSKSFSVQVDVCVFALYLSREKKRQNHEIRDINNGVHRTTHPHFNLGWVTSGQSPSPLKWSLMVIRSSVLDQAYLITPSALEEMLNSINLSFFRLLALLITYLFAPRYYLLTMLPFSNFFWSSITTFHFNCSFHH